MKKKHKILLILIMLLTIFLEVDLIHALTGSNLMDTRAREISNESRYAIITSYSLHKTKVYDTKDDYKVVALSQSCGPAKAILGSFTLTGRKERDMQGSKKDANGSVYHEFYASWLENGVAIHSILYERGSEEELYHEIGIQDSKHPYSNNWSNGCTRASKELCKFVYENCDKGTPYLIF